MEDLRLVSCSLQGFEAGAAQTGQDHLPISADPKLAKARTFECLRLAFLEEEGVRGELRLPPADAVPKRDLVGGERSRIGQAAEPADATRIECDDEVPVGKLRSPGRKGLIGNREVQPRSTV